jgi:septal ring factor EnvC (AmiA/AmiB activator)
MARVRTIESINVEIAKIQEELNNLHQKYDKTAAKLEVLQEQKQKYQTKLVMKALQSSGKSFDELMTFLKP